MSLIPPHEPTHSPPLLGLVRLGRDHAEIKRLAPTPVLRTVTVDDETAVLEACSTAATSDALPTLPDGFARALARTCTEDVVIMTSRLSTGVVTDRTDTADLAVVRAAFSPFTVLPGEQPRGGTAGGRVGQVPDPVIGRDSGADNLGLRVLVFSDTDHLRSWCADALSRSLRRARKRGRPLEIAATGVRRPIAVSMVLVQFQDGTAEQWVPMVSDGISRLAVCAAVLLGHFDDDVDDAATAMVDHLLPVDDLSEVTAPHGLARRMRRNHQHMVRQYERHLDQHRPDEEAVTIRQFLTLPADLCLVARDPMTGQAHPMETAMEAVVSDLHTGVDGWDHGDGARFSALRAVKQLARAGAIDPTLAKLCLSQHTRVLTLPLEPGEDQFGAAEPSASRPPRADTIDGDRALLRRGVTLLARFLGQSHYEPFKAALKSVNGRQRMSLHQVIDGLAPLVCEPWGTRKPLTRAWAYGGPVPAWLTEVDLDPVHPDDYLSLVRDAIDPEMSGEVVAAARLELALAGGTALIADGILTTALVGGSGGTTNHLGYRGSVGSFVEALSATEEGLTALAVAANNFKPSVPSRSARLPDIDLDRPDRTARDGVGIPIRTSETALAALAARAETPSDNPQGAARADLSSEPSTLDTLRARAQHLPSEARAMLRSVELTKTLHDESGGPSGLTEDDLDTVLDSLSRTLRLAGRLT